MEIGLFRDIQNNLPQQQSELFQFRKKRHTRGMKLFNISLTSKFDPRSPSRLKKHYISVSPEDVNRFPSQNQHEALSVNLTHNCRGRFSHRKTLNR